MEKPRALLIAIDSDLVNKLFPIDANWDLINIKDKTTFETELDSLSEQEFQIAICGDQLGLVFAHEFAQVFKQLHSTLNMFFVTSQKEGYEASTLKKNGFTDVFLLPMDLSLIKLKCAEVLEALANSPRSYKKIFVGDLQAQTELPFSTFVYLPLNNKHIRFSSENQALGTDRLNRMQQKNFTRLFIDKKESKNFYKYSFERLKGNGISETERIEKVTSEVRNMVSSLLDSSDTASFEKGKELLSDCQKIVSLLVSGGKKENFYARLQANLGNSISSYDHSATVSTIAALFAEATQLAKPDDMAIAGFFHDLGRADIEDSLLNLPYAEWPKETFLNYQSHPQLSVNLLKERKMIISPKIEKAIIEHHEKFDGTGFPKKLSGTRICVEAQLLSLVDQLVYLTVIVEGSPQLNIKEAFDIIKRNGSIGPEILFKISAVLSKN